MTDTTYNGWTNYATWRVALEIFDGYDPDGSPVTADWAEEYVHELMGDTMRTDTGMGAIIKGWVNTFLHGVDWQEIADHINEAHELNPEEN